MHFWDYGNGFLKEAGKADAAVFRLDKQHGAFSYPSYVEDIMGWALHQWAREQGQFFCADVFWRECSGVV